MGVLSNSITPIILISYGLFTSVISFVIIMQVKNASRPSDSSLVGLQPQATRINVSGLFYGIVTMFGAVAILASVLLKKSIDKITAAVELILGAIGIGLVVVSGVWYGKNGGCSGAQEWMGLQPNDDNGGICGLWTGDLIMISGSIILWFTLGITHFLNDRYSNAVLPYCERPRVGAEQPSR